MKAASHATHLRRMDWISAVATALLIVIGILFVYSACYRDSGQNAGAFYRKQMLSAAIGVVFFFLFARFDYRRLRELSWWLYAAGILLLVLVLVAGRRVYGARRWLSLFGFTLQPSELVKLATIICLAAVLGKRRRDLRRFRYVVAVMLLTAVPAVMIVKEPDLGTAMVFVPIAFGVMFVAGVPMRFLAMLALIGLLFLPFAWLGMDEYQKNRIIVFFDPDRDPLGAGWNKMQSEIAVGSGGFWGKGYRNGTQNILGFLPRTVAPTDFVFSVIAEEKGFVGSVGILSLYFIVLLGTTRAALRGRDKFGRLLCTGIGCMIFSHVFVNIAMTVGLMPITGLPLPLISYGGSFLVTTLAALGMIQSVYIRSQLR